MKAEHSLGGDLQCVFRQLKTVEHIDNNEHRQCLLYNMPFSEHVACTRSLGFLLYRYRNTISH